MSKHNKKYYSKPEKRAHKNAHHKEYKLKKKYGEFYEAAIELIKLEKELRESPLTASDPFFIERQRQRQKWHSVKDIYNKRRRKKNESKERFS